MTKQEDLKHQTHLLNIKCATEAGEKAIQAASNKEYHIAKTWVYVAEQFLKDVDETSKLEVILNITKQVNLA